MLECHAKRFGSRPAILGEGGLQLSHQEMHAPMATLSLELPLSRKFTREIAAGAEAGTPASAWDAALKSCNETVFQDLQPSEEAGR